MTNATHLSQQLTQARNELNNLRNTLRGLQAEHRQDVCAVREVMAGTHTASPTHRQPSTPQEPATPPDAGLLQDWKAIGHIRSWFRTKNGTPRQGSVSSLTRGVLRLAPHTFNNPHHALQGLEEFSHVWILFVFDKNEGSGRGHMRSKVAPPRLGGQRVGVFGTRSPHRPNPLGLTLARLDKVEGDCLHLSGLDILDGTPVLDIKPYILHYDAPPIIASHFTNCKEDPALIKPDEENEDAVSHGNCLESQKYDPSQEENQNQGKLSPQIETENVMCSGSEGLGNKSLDKPKITPGNPRINPRKPGKLNQILHTSEDSDRTEREEELIESLRQAALFLGASEEESRDNNTHFPDHEEKSREKNTHLDQNTHLDKNTPFPDVSDEKSREKNTRTQQEELIESLRQAALFLGASEEESRENNTRSPDHEEKSREKNTHLDQNTHFPDVSDEKSREKNTHTQQEELIESLRQAALFLGASEEESRDNNTHSPDHEEKSRDKNTHFPDPISKSGGCKDRQQGDEAEDRVVMAAWLADPPTQSLHVLFHPIAEQQIETFSSQAEDGKYRLEYLSSGSELRVAIASVLKQDPRSVYRRSKCSSLLYYFSVDTAHITAWFEGSCVEVLRVQPLTTQSHISLQES